MKSSAVVARRKAESPRPIVSPPEVRGPAAGGPVGAMHAELSARLTAAEYEGWLLPPEPRSGLERFVHTLSLCAGVAALTAGTALIWLII